LPRPANAYRFSTAVAFFKDDNIVYILEPEDSSKARPVRIAFRFTRLSLDAPHGGAGSFTLFKNTFFTVILIISLASCGGGDGGDSINTESAAVIPKYSIGSTSRTFYGSPGSAEPIPVYVYYPAENQGIDTAVSEGCFPLVIFSHGYQQSPEDYYYISEALVPEGYIVALSDNFSNAAIINIDEYAADINFVLEELYNLAKGDDPVLGSHISATSALLGHSTGGGATVIAAADSVADAVRQANTIAILAPLGQTFLTITGTDPYTAAGDVEAPALIFAGGKDCICPSESHADLIYDNLDTTNVNYLLTIKDGDHCGFSDVEGPGNILCDSTELTFCLLLQGETIDPIEQNRLTARILKPWLDHFLKDDSDAWLTFQQRIDDERLSVESSDTYEGN
jgi:predicted dienelactone hydrolase